MYMYRQSAIGISTPGQKWDFVFTKDSGKPARGSTKNQFAKITCLGLLVCVPSMAHSNHRYHSKHTCAIVCFLFGVKFSIVARQTSLLDESKIRRIVSLRHE